jgi:drug/metabolite transporter (DMT)-like permease
LPALVFAPTSWPALNGIGAIFVLGIACTGAAFMLFYTLVGQIGAGRAMVITYLSPGFSVLLGVMFLGESFTISTTTGLGLILFGSWMATDNRLLDWSKKRRQRQKSHEEVG